MPTDATLLRKITQGGIYPGQPATSVLVPAVQIGGKTRRTPQQAAKLMAAGAFMRRIATKKRRNPDVSTVKLIHMLTGAIVTQDDADEILRTVAHRSIHELKTLYGITPKQAEKLEALGLLYQSIANARIPDRVSLQRPELVYDYFAPMMAGVPVEQLWILPCDVHVRLIGKPVIVSRGDVDGTEASPRPVFRAAITRGAIQINVIHNHPSGNLNPSEQDRAITKRLVQAGRMLDIKVIDHIIFSLNGFVSLRSNEPGLFS
jgi:DNA repair protein RadC